jgi:hypothetical protein
MTMLLHLLVNTPRWVFALFFVLLALGLRQLSDRQASAARKSALPIAMVALSYYGLQSDFGVQPSTLAAWGAGALFMLGRSPLPAARYDAASGTFRVPGSAAPLALMLTVFAVKYAVAVALIMQPALRKDLLWNLAGAALYGAFSGLFAGRAVRSAWHWVLTASRRSTL